MERIFGFDPSFLGTLQGLTGLFSSPLWWMCPKPLLATHEWNPLPWPRHPLLGALASCGLLLSPAPWKQRGLGHAPGQGVSQ